jgi:hypothetical protein
MVTRVGSKREHNVMEPILTPDGSDAGYVERTIEGFAWMCDDCGLIWEKKWHAETCIRRSHVRVWEQRYGGYVENGIHRGGKAFPRVAIGRRPVVVRQCAHEHAPLHRTCGVGVCYDCGDHKGLVRCFCGWAASGGNGRRELLEMGETL